MPDKPTTETYRAIVVFSSVSVKDAKTKAESAAKSCGGKLDRLTVQRLTWGPVLDEGEGESE